MEEGNVASLGYGNVWLDCVLYYFEYFHAYGHYVIEKTKIMYYKLKSYGGMLE